MTVAAHPRSPCVVAAAALLALAGCYASHGRPPEAAGDAGVDVGRRDAGRYGGPPDLGMTPSCAAQDARAVVCPTLFCDDVGAWHWNGDRCVYIECGACEGTDCGAGAITEGECFRSHASCVPSLCRASGGEWLFWAQECGHRECGYPVPELCEAGFPICDCGLSGVFDAARGCVDGMCGEIDPLPRDLLCTSTGGRWDAICCDTVCGQRCELPCAAPACDCGPSRIFDLARGCVETSRCFERTRGETCGPGARCEAGTICCERCGGAGCFGDPVCAAPTCDSDAHTDECGNRDDLP